ncbi:MAG: CPBP family intramembrane metalloprotease [Candidatus Competibacteraceae bacterium]|nr:CPBP family intramembrane metalloprotease [Candidatus Competibacteraceae bacterium]
MGLAVLLFAGGLLFWIGLRSGQRRWLLSGGSLLLIPFAGMVASGSIAPVILPVLAGGGILVWALKTPRCPPGALQIAAGLGYLLLVLALGFRQFPGLTPFSLLDVSGKEVLFPPEKLLLLALVPPLVLTPLQPDRWRWGCEPPGKTFALALPVTLLVLIPLALFLEHLRPGWTHAPIPVLVYGLAYNFLFVCVLEESFFRGIVQTLCMRWARHWSRSSHADGWGLIIASLLFGGVHAGGGLTFVFLATLAGFAYGLVYYLTGRMDYAVFLHFAVNTVHQLAFAALPTPA